MAMNSSFLALTILIISITFLHLLSTTSCLNHKQQPPDTVQGLLVEEKTRLGSTPPSCHNKCNNCHPCMAVQVPTMPSHNQLKPRVSRATEMDDDNNSFEKYSSSISSPSLPSSSSVGYNRYSNYKPLGWKCGCNGHFYNP